MMRKDARSSIYNTQLEIEFEVEKVDTSSGVFVLLLLGPALLLSLVSRRSIMRDTVAIPAFTSLLTSEPISTIEELRENSFSFKSFVLFAIDSLYLKT